MIAHLAKLNVLEVIVRHLIGTKNGIKNLCGICTPHKRVILVGGVNMKNYTYGWLLQSQGYVEVPESEYTDRMLEMKEFIDMLSEVVVKANCGWDGVEYKVMKYTDNSIEKYMVLCVDGHGERWIPINGNSKGCNLSVLGENLW
jgi:hypothetical protein